jgi:hypothetical protein
MTRAELAEALKAEDPETVQHALIAAALHDRDAAWLERTLMRFLSDSREGVRGIAANGLGHVARLHGSLDLNVVVPVLREMAGRGGWEGGKATDALDDIAVYMRDTDPR